MISKKTKNLLILIILISTCFGILIKDLRISFILIINSVLYLTFINSNTPEIYKSPLFWVYIIGGVLIYTFLYFYLLWYLILGVFLYGLLLAFYLLHSFFSKSAIDTLYILLFANILVVFATFMLIFNILLFKDLLYLESIDPFLNIPLYKTTGIHYAFGQPTLKECYAAPLTINTYNTLGPRLMLLNTPHTPFIVTTLFSLSVFNMLLSNSLFLIID